MRIALLATAVLLALPSASLASSASRSGDRITITAAPGEANHISVGAPNSTVDVSDTGASLTAGDGCVQVSATEADCGPKDSPRVSVDLGDGNDTLLGQNYFNVGAFDVHGGPGNDTIAGSIVGDTLHGDEGNDSVEGRDGNDLVAGDDGDDDLAGGSDDDVVVGGPGQDALSGDGSNFQYDGSDQILSRDGERDSVTCGLGSDSVTADSLDVLDADGQCESVDVEATSPPPPDELTIALGTKPTGKLSKLVSAKGFAFEVAASGACKATVSITVAAKSAKRAGLARHAVTLAKETAQLPDAGRFPATLRAQKKYRAKLRKLRKLPAQLSFACSAGGVTKHAHHAVTFRAG